MVGYRPPLTDRKFADSPLTPAPESGDKLTRFGPFRSPCRAGNVKIRRGAWNEELFRVLEGFPDLAHDRRSSSSNVSRSRAKPIAPGSVEWQAEQETRSKA
jgi:phage terminase large subunit-like protein